MAQAVNDHRGSPLSTQKRLVGALFEKAFAGSAHDLVMRALSLKPASREEIAAIRALLDEAEQKESSSDLDAAKPFACPAPLE